jgi:aminoacrylate hydrolase
MPHAEIDGIRIYCEIHGRHGTCVFLIVGLGGLGRSWCEQVARFAQDHVVIIADHLGSGNSSFPNEGYTIAQHTADMAGLLKHLGISPVPVVGSSTGGAIAQVIAIDHACSP